MKESVCFASLGLGPDMVDRLNQLNFVTPTAIQQAAIPELLTGDRDIIGIARTGTGKTACFALPIITHLDLKSSDTQALVLVPTRELALQTANEFEKFKGKLKIAVLPVFGGSAYEPQLRALRRGAQVVVGTPGRLIDLLDRGVLQIENVKYLVLDEADDMLNMGFIEDIETILTYAPQEKRMLLFSATMPPRIRQIANRFMKEKLEINLHDKDLTATLVKQIYYEVGARDKMESLRRVIDLNSDFYGIVFCRTKVETDEVNQNLQRFGYASEALHGDITQVQRTKIVQRFRESHIKILVATDVASRGVDIEGLTHVINFSLPTHAELYVHRIGRTGRAGRTGTAISIVTPQERRFLESVKRFAKSTIVREKLPDVKSVLDSQKQFIATAVNELAAGYDEKPKAKSVQHHCLALAQSLLQQRSAETIIAALLGMNYQGRLSEDSYREITEISEQRREPRHRDGRDGPSSKKPFARGRERGERDQRSDRGERDQRSSSGGSFQRKREYAARDHDEKGYLIRKKPAKKPSVGKSI